MPRVPPLIPSPRGMRLPSRTSLPSPFAPTPSGRPTAGGDTMQSIVQWLAETGMEHYAPMFEAQRIELDVIGGLTDADLKEIGITALGDRKRILAAIAQGNPVDAGSPVAQPASRPPATPQVAERRQLTMMFCDLVGST